MFEIGRLGLGTVQFGLSYGISNSSGQTTVDESQTILRVASDAGIRIVDTAIEYGESESRIGSFNANEFKIVTKIPYLNLGAYTVEDLIKKYGDGIQCEHCGIKLMEAALTKKKIDELSDWEKKVDQFSKKWKDLDSKEKSYTQLKKDFDEYERNKLVKEKYEISLESTNLKLSQTQEKLKRYQEVQDRKMVKL